MDLVARVLATTSRHSTGRESDRPTVAGRTALLNGRLAGGPGVRASERANKAEWIVFTGAGRGGGSSLVQPGPAAAARAAGHSGPIRPG